MGLMVVGAVLIASFFSLSMSLQGLGVSYIGASGFESQKELNFWLATVLLLSPGAFCLMWPLRERLQNAVTLVGNYWNELDPRDRKTFLILFFLLAALVARVGHGVILKGFPITDDEIGARVGGQVWATGQLMAPIWEPFSAYMHPFMFVKNGAYTSFELPGVLAVWGLGTVIGDPAMIWALLAAVPIVCMVLIVRRFMPLGWSVFAAFVFFFAPQALALSFTTHAHLLPRALLALALLSFVCEAPLWLGLITGIGILSRPYEFGAILLPFLVCFAWENLRWEKEKLKRVVVFAGGLIGPLILFALYNLATTGSALDMARSHPAFHDITFPGYEELQKVVKQGVPLTIDTLWRRFGGNLTNNFLGIAVWFYAPIGLPLAAYGVFANRFTRLLGLGFIASLAIALGHDNYGIHMVGPINYSAVPVLLALLFVFGVRRLFEKSAAWAIPGFASGFHATAAAGLLSALIFLSVNLCGVYQQAQIHSYVYNFVQEKVRPIVENGETQVVVLADRFLNVWWQTPPVREIGSYVYEWRIPDPDLSDRVLFLRDDPNTLAQLKQKFSKHVFLRLKSIKEPPYLELSPLG